MGQVLPALADEVQDEIVGFLVPVQVHAAAVEIVVHVEDVVRETVFFQIVSGGGGEAAFFSEHVIERALNAGKIPGVHVVRGGKLTAPLQARAEAH